MRIFDLCKLIKFYQQTIKNLQNAVNENGRKTIRIDDSLMIFEDFNKIYDIPYLI